MRRVLCKHHHGGEVVYSVDRQVSVIVDEVVWIPLPTVLIYTTCYRYRYVHIGYLLVLVSCTKCVFVCVFVHHHELRIEARAFTCMLACCSKKFHTTFILQM